MMFLTRLPVPAGTDHHPTYLMRSTMVREGRAAGPPPRQERRAVPPAMRARACPHDQPTPTPCTPSPAPQYFPLIGVVVGLWGAVFFNAAQALWPPAVAAGVSVMATVWLTGGAHAPGVGAGAGQPPPLRLAVSTSA
jgi:hypothetical protein